MVHRFLGVGGDLLLGQQRNHCRLRHGGWHLGGADGLQCVVWLEHQLGRKRLFSQPNRFQNDIGDTYKQPGWRYFSNTEVSYPHNQPVRAQFVATRTGTPLYMSAVFPAIAHREYASVMSPPIVEFNSTADSPAIVVRQIGDAWDKPFAVVYEPQALQMTYQGIGESDQGHSRLGEHLQKLDATRPMVLA